MDDGRAFGFEQRARSRVAGQLRGLRGCRPALRKFFVGVLAASLLVPVATERRASAAGPAVVSVSVSIVDPATNAVVSQVTPATMRQYAVNVAYTCNIADCTGVSVFLAGTPVDPTYGTHRKEGAYTYTPPFAGAPTPTGSAAAGITVPLGNVTAGTGGTFRITYTIDTGRDRVSHASYFPNGSLVQPDVTITATNSDNPGTGTATATWVNSTPSPTLSVTRSVATTRTDLEVTITASEGVRCYGLDAGGHVVGRPALLCAAGHTMTVTLPERATYVAGSGGSYDPGTHTVSFSNSGEPYVRGASGSFRVTFSSADYPTAGAECVADEAFTATGSTTYLDTTVHSPPQATASVEVQNCSPFADATIDVKTVTRTAGTSTNPIINIPLPDAADYAGYWLVTARNRANIDGVATITEANLDQPDMPVTTIHVVAGGGGTITYTLDGGTAVTTTAGLYTAPAGRRIVAATVTSGNLRGPNATDAGTATTAFSVRFWFTVTDAATAGTRTNTASALMSYPAYPDLDDVALGPESRSVLLEPTDPPEPPPVTPPVLTVGASGPTTAGGSVPVVDADVSWTVNASVTNAPNVNTIVPQYVYVAPAGWTITDVTFNTSPPAGYTQQLRMVTLSGVARSAVVVTWPAAIAIPESGTAPTFPVMTVKTKPTVLAPAGTNNNIADFFFADTAEGEATYSPGAYVDAADLDGDGDVTETYATRQRSSSLAATFAVGVDKEICRPNPSATDGCDWIADPSVTVGVPPGATSIKYRVTIRNDGNAALNNVWAYDVLPYIGDTGTTTATAGTPRGSTVREVVSSVSDIGTGLTLSYSNSTNPARPQVYSGPTDLDDWQDSTFTGASAIRAQLPSLPAFESRSFVYEAALVDGGADEIACNSVAVIADTQGALEPAPACATTQEADFAIEVADRVALQEGRVGVVPFVVTNGGGSALAAGTVTLSLPVGLSAVELDAIADWSCSAPTLAGPVDVTCRPINADGTSRALARDVPETIPLSVRGVASDPGPYCVHGSVEGLMHDPEPADNDTDGCSLVFSGALLLDVNKTDSVTTSRPGETLTYTITMANRLTGEALPGAVLVDQLPANVVFVGASDGGTLAGADGDGRGGVVTWPAVDLAAGGTATADGADGIGAAGSSVTRTVTVRVVPQATGQVVNTAEATAADPADPSVELTDVDGDTDELQRMSLSKSSNAANAGVREGDIITYTVTATNDGTVDYTSGDPATLVDDLSAVLDDATFVDGSAVARVDGGVPAPVDDPDGDGLLLWSGPLPVGSVVEVTYQVAVGDGGSGDRTLTNTAFAADEPGTCTDGLDGNGASCASVSSSFAAIVAKTVSLVEHNDDGTWTVVYDLFVTNLDPGQPATYDLSDALAFGTGIDVVTATVTDAPVGVTPEPWAGSGPIATDVVVLADSQHAYQLTVVADAHDTAGSPAARCVTGIAGGFANTATITLTDGRTATDEACAAPVAPEVEKTATPSAQLPNGTWSTIYTVTVRNPHPAPATLAYTLDDMLTIPAGIAVDDVTVVGPDGAPVNAAFDGATETGLLTGVDRIDAASATTPTTRVYTITLITDAPAGAAQPSELACPAAGTGGYSNVVRLHAGSGATELDAASACTPALAQPAPTISKRVTSSSIDTDGLWTVNYEIDVHNPDVTYSTRYSLTDELQFAVGVTVVDVDVVSGDATPAASWNGQSNTIVVTDQSLAPGATHRYTVLVTADPGTLDPESAVADCRIDPGETGTGYRNIATVTSGATSTFAEACEPITDPSVVKTRVGEPTQDPATGVWTLTYDVSVTNRSTTTSGTIPYTLTDELSFPVDVEIVDIDTTAPASATTNPDFNGSTDTELGSGAIGAAADETTPAKHVFSVTVDFRIPAGLSSVVQCAPQQGPGGLRNEVEIAVGQRVSGAVACADVPVVPAPGAQKTVVSSQQQTDGTWRVLYEVTVANPSTTAASTYTLNDQLTSGDGIAPAEPPVVLDTPTDVDANPFWDGDTTTTLAANVLLPAGGSHTYTVRAVLDAGDVRRSDLAGDCALDGGEAGTGFRNVAMIDTGVTTRDSSACTTPFDPTISKQLNGVPELQSDGSWLLAYTMTVTNPSPDAAVRYGLADELDFPAGTTVTVVTAAGRAGSPTVQADWDGRAQPTLVADGTLLAANDAHVFDVVVRAMLPDGQQSTLGGWRNVATVDSGVGGVVENSAEASADIELPRLSVEKAVTAAPIVRIGDQVEYSVTIENIGVGDYTAHHPAVVWDDLTDVLDDANLLGTPASTAGTATMVGPRVRWNGALASGSSVTLTYTVAIARGGDAQLDNIAFGAAPDDPTPTTPDLGACGPDPACSATHTGMPALAIEKTASASQVTPGNPVHYTVRVTNTGDVALTDAVPAAISDDLSDVLDDATYTGDAHADIGNVAVTGSTLTWTGALAAGQTATITYSVIADADADGATLRNVATSTPTLAALSVGGAPINGTVSATTAVRSDVPADPDTDDDGLLDEEETGRYGTDPNVPNAPSYGLTKYVPLFPARVLDTRSGLGWSGAMPMAGTTITLPVLGHGGVPDDPEIKAVVFNLTATEGTEIGYVTAYPSGISPPFVSNLNVDRAGETVANLVTVPIGPDGSVQIYSMFATHLVADVAGYYRRSADSTDGRLHPVTPARILDTRAASAIGHDGHKPAAAETLTVHVAGRGGVPATGAAAVVLTVTATEATAPGFVTAWPGGTQLPLASNLNLYRSGQTVANQVIVPIGPDGTVQLYTQSGTHLVADVTGWFTDSTAEPSFSGLFVPIEPVRKLDTRLAGQEATAEGTVTVFTLPGTIPGVAAAAAALNATATETDGPGYITAFPTGIDMPYTSVLNLEGADETIADHVIAPVTDGNLALYSHAGAHLVADVVGWYRE